MVKTISKGIFKKNCLWKTWFFWCCVCKKVSKLSKYIQLHVQHELFIHRIMRKNMENEIKKHFLNDICKCYLHKTGSFSFICMLRVSLAQTIWRVWGTLLWKSKQEVVLSKYSSKYPSVRWNITQFIFFYFWHFMISWFVLQRCSISNTAIINKWFINRWLKLF